MGNTMSSFDYRTNYVLPTQNGNFLRKTSKGVWFENRDGEMLRPSNEYEWQSAIHNWGVAPKIEKDFPKYQVMEGSILYFVYKLPAQIKEEDAYFSEDSYKPLLAYDIETNTVFDFDEAKKMDSNLSNTVTTKSVQRSMDELRNVAFGMFNIACESSHVMALEINGEPFFEPFFEEWSRNLKTFEDIKKEVDEWNKCELTGCESMFALFNVMLAYELLSKESK